jgi:N-terminal domain of reverse transcriptase
MGVSSRRSFRITGRIPGLVPGRESALTRSGEPVRRKMTEAPEPEDKLDATATVVVNGPEDAPFDWHAIDWRRVEDDVRRLRQRIFTASKAGDLARVRSLQKLMMRSRANTLQSVRRVTERNAGRLTAGLDGEVVLTPEARARLVERIERPRSHFCCVADRAISERLLHRLLADEEKRDGDAGEPRHDSGLVSSSDRAEPAFRGSPGADAIAALGADLPESPGL